MNFVRTLPCSEKQIHSVSELQYFLAERHQMSIAGVNAMGGQGGLGPLMLLEHSPSVTTDCLDIHKSRLYKLAIAVTVNGKQNPVHNIRARYACSRYACSRYAS